MISRARRMSWDRLFSLRQRKGVRNVSTLGLVVLGPVLAVVTYLGMGPFELDPSSGGIRLILLADLIYAIVVAALVLQAVARMVAARRANSAGSQLHLRLTGVFATVALIPTVLVAVFAVITVNFGLEGWFSERVRSVVGTSLAAAQAYEGEQRSDLGEDARRLAGYLNEARSSEFLMPDSTLQQILTQSQGQIQRGVKEAYIIDGSGALRTRGKRSYLFDFERPSEAQMDVARGGELVIVEDWPNNEFRAILRLDSFGDRYIYLSRAVDGQLLSLLDTTRENVRLYQQLENDRGRLLFEFGLLYLGFAVLLILAAIWLGLWFAERLARPVGQLAQAAERVGRGDLDVQVQERGDGDEIASLGRVFNQMTRELKGQRETLLANTEQIERRRRLFDSVLGSVTAGVMGLDAAGRVTFANRSALRLLNLGTNNPIHEPIGEVVPEFKKLFARLRNEGLDATQGEVKLTRNGKLESLLVRMSRRVSDEGTEEGFVVAFDDVTELVSAQKMAAWGDVARRIAHEIKNPLTPIKLSAERIRRKFAPLAGDQADALEQYTGVIMRQTDDLRRIVDEFSKFARMPEPERRATDLAALLRDAVTLQRSGQPDVDIKLTGAENPLITQIDQTMMGQALTNLIKNAGEAIETLVETGACDDGFEPEIRVRLELRPTRISVTISDNGVGLPEDRARLFEPYVTTRAKGTGLGLPIVKKIIEEHGGTLILRDAPLFDGASHRGAEAVIDLPRFEARQDESVRVEQKNVA